MNDDLFLIITIYILKECLLNRRFPSLQVIAQQDQAAGQDEENYKYRIRKRNYRRPPRIEDERGRFTLQLLGNGLPGEQHDQHRTKQAVK